MPSETPKSSNEHDNASNSETCTPTDDFKNTMNKWVRDPNGWIAICTIGLLFIGFCALHISQDTEKKQLRAYLALDNMQTSGSGTVINVKFNVENFGQTPAKNCYISGNLAIMPFPLPSNHVFPIPPTKFKQSSIITPRATKPSTVDVHATVTPDEKKEIFSTNSERRLYLFGVLNYQDIFNDYHFLKFCYFLNIEGKPKKSLKRTDTPISWVDCDQHTDFD